MARSKFESDSGENRLTLHDLFFALESSQKPEVKQRSSSSNVTSVLEQITENCAREKMEVTDSSYIEALIEEANLHFKNEEYGCLLDNIYAIGRIKGEYDYLRKERDREEFDKSLKKLKKTAGLRKNNRSKKSLKKMAQRIASIIWSLPRYSNYTINEVAPLVRELLNESLGSTPTKSKNNENESNYLEFARTLIPVSNTYPDGKKYDGLVSWIKPVAPVSAANRKGRPKKNSETR